VNVPLLLLHAHKYGVDEHDQSATYASSITTGTQVTTKGVELKAAGF